jgi:hypothetical protein
MLGDNMSKIRFTITTTEEEDIKTYMQANDMKSVLFEIIWGRFYSETMKHGDLTAKYKTIDEALWAYRDYICQMINDHNITID